MANEEHLAILRQGVEVWNAWRRENPDVVPDLSKADLHELDLHWEVKVRAIFGAIRSQGTDRGNHLMTLANEAKANLERANLEHAKLRGANLEMARLNKANLYRADLREANLSRADLSEANLSRAALIGAKLEQAFLNDANLTGAWLMNSSVSRIHIGDTIFVDTDLSNVQGLESVQHTGPSQVSISTLVLSRGEIPEIFLRGCGVPDIFIEYLPALVGAMQPIQYYSCFISYSAKDEAFAKRLHGRMQQEHLRVWFAPEDMEGGKKLHEQIERAIQLHDRLLLILSDNSLQSEWVMTELYNARQVELKENRRKLFPIRLTDMDTIKAWRCFDADTGKDLAREIREYYIPDFSHWKDHDSFEREFAKLLSALKATEALPTPRAALPKITPKDMPQEPEKIIARLKQRLAVREEQAAIYGIDVPPHIATELADLKNEINRLGG